jgi:uncharacterized membrane protein YbhN (UPF0104 family)
MALILGLSIAGVALGAVGREGLDAFRTAPSPRVGFLAAAFGCAVTEIALAAWRLHVLAKRLAPGITYLDCVRAHLGNMCLSGLTPGLSGGGAAQLFLLARAGLAPSRGAALVGLNFLASSVVLLLGSVSALYFLADDLPAWLRRSTAGTAVILAVALVGGGVLLLRRDGPPALRVSPESGDTGGPGWLVALRRTAGRARDFLQGSLAAARALPRRYPGTVAALLPLTAAAFTMRAATAYAVFRAFQESGYLSELITTLIILILALFFAPTPGASGFAEAASTAYLVGALGPAKSVGFVLYWRLLTLYLPVAIGGAVVLHRLDLEVRNAASRDRSRDRTDLSSGV